MTLSTAVAAPDQAPSRDSFRLIIKQHTMIAALGLFMHWANMHLSVLQMSQSNDSQVTENCTYSAELRREAFFTRRAAGRYIIPVYGLTVNESS